jgi:hypothetical protein
LEMLSGPYEIRAPSSSMRLSVLFREESTMTPSRATSARKTLRAIAEAVRARGHQISHEGVAGVLRVRLKTAIGEQFA